jgi:hypothetical protein
MRRTVTLSLIFTLVSLSCKSRTNQTSETRHIFADQQRFNVDIAKFSGILRVETGCTAFVIDRQQQVAMTAKHCGIKVGDSIFAGYTDPASPGMRSQVKEILAESPDLTWDFVVFRYVQPRPNVITQEFRLAATDLVTELANALPGSLNLKMVGYPVDSYRNGKLTESRCDVRYPTEEFPYGFRSKAQEMLNTWQRDPHYARDRRYSEAAAVRMERWVDARIPRDRNPIPSRLLNLRRQLRWTNLC